MPSAVKSKLLGIQLTNTFARNDTMQCVCDGAQWKRT